VSPNLHSPRLIRCLVVGVAAIAMAAPTATAAPADQFLGPPGSCETQVVAKYRAPARVPAPPSCEEQVVASRGTGAPAPAKPTEADTFPGLAAEVRDVPRVESADAGLDWASAAIGAATAAGLLALASLGALATSRRSRVRTAR
jgi:hypothetical protein